MKYVVLLVSLVVFGSITASWAQQDEGEHWTKKHPAPSKTEEWEIAFETRNSPIQVASTPTQPTQEQICLGILELRIAAQDGRYKKIAVGGKDLETIDELYKRECSKLRSPEGLEHAYRMIEKVLD